MGYSFHIERGDANSRSEIRLDEWLAAVREAEGVRESEEDVVGVNPRTRETIVIKRREGDAQVRFIERKRFFRRKVTWETVFSWRNGSAYFGSRFDFQNAKHPVRLAAAALASSLGAKIRGDDGEEYDW